MIGDRAHFAQLDNAAALARYQQARAALDAAAAEGVAALRSRLAARRAGSRA